MSAQPERTLMLWFPDWPVTAYRKEREGAAPVAVMEHNRVVACSASARAEGVRQGQRRRDAQSRCPRLEVVAADPVRDHRVFSPVLSRIEAYAPRVQVVQPGLCALRARGPARYYGGEAQSVRVLRDALVEDGFVDVRGAVADGVFTAEQAAKHGTDAVTVVPVGGAAEYLAPLSVEVLSNTEAGCRVPEIVSLLARLGVQTLGAFAAMEVERVRERFAEQGVRVHALAAGGDSQQIRPRTPPPELDCEVVFEPPLELAEQVAFGVRTGAEEFISRLGRIDLVCTELRVELTGDHGDGSERVWLHPERFDPAAVVDRVRWQLAENRLRTPVSAVRIHPEAVEAAAHHAPEIFGSGAEERVHHALSRAQAMLGHHGVLTPAVGGGRWLTERQVLIPWGDRHPRARAGLRADRAKPWPGSLPDPLPVAVFARPRPAQVRTLGGYTVEVDPTGAVSAVPAELDIGGERHRVQAWAGPWPVIERGWDGERARRAYRFQIVDDDGAAWLLVFEHGAWAVEGSYD